MVMAGDMGEGEGIGTTIRTGDTKIGAITAGRIGPAAGAVVGVGVVSRSSL